MWTGKVCIITGSSIGIGKQLAIKVAEKGGKVVLNARNPERLAMTAKELQEMGYDVGFHAGDVSNYNDCLELVQYTIERFHALDVLINNAGISADGNLQEFNPEIFKKVVDVNLMGSVYMTHAAMSALQESAGSVMFIGSVAGIHGLPGHSAYSSSKMALTALAESLRIELAGSGVHIGLAYVGFTENDPQKTILDKDGNIIPQPSRGLVKAEPTDKVVYRILSMIERRKFKQVFTPIGKLHYFLVRMIPGILMNILLMIMKRRKRKSS